MQHVKKYITVLKNNLSSLIVCGNLSGLYLKYDKVLNSCENVSLVV